MLYGKVGFEEWPRLAKFTARYGTAQNCRFTILHGRWLRDSLCRQCRCDRHC